MPNRGGQPGFGILAWAGWLMRVPSDWRALRVAGDWGRGSMVVGDATEALMQVKWLRVPPERFDAARWLRRRLGKVAGDSAGDGPRPQGFSETAWASRRGGANGALWYGYAPEAGMVIEVVVGGRRRTAEQRVLPSLRASARGGATRWAVFGSSFESPPGFALVAQRLQLGDVALLFRGADRSRFVLRQVYPAQLALARRDLADWLEFPVFKEGRRFRPTERTRDWKIDLFGTELAGVLRTGRKQLPLPLGWIAPRRSIGAVVHDRALDRLLIAEHDSRGEPDEALLATALRSMNWALREGAE